LVLQCMSAGGTAPVVHAHAYAEPCAGFLELCESFAAVSGPRHAVCIKVKDCMHMLCNFALVCGLTVLRCAVCAFTQCPRLCAPQP